MRSTLRGGSTSPGAPSSVTTEPLPRVPVPLLSVPPTTAAGPVEGLGEAAPVRETVDGVPEDHHPEAPETRGPGAIQAAADSRVAAAAPGTSRTGRSRRIPYDQALDRCGPPIRPIDRSLPTAQARRRMDWLVRCTISVPSIEPITSGTVGPPGFTDCPSLELAVEFIRSP